MTTSSSFLKSAFGDNKKRLTAGIVVIGDEILRGSIADSNSHFICNRLHNRGVLVKKIAVIADDVQEIADEVSAFSKAFDYVFTTGGVGPTHDDKTFEGLAIAFNDKLVTCEELKRIVGRYLRRTKLRDVEAAVEKFCLLPSCAKLIKAKNGEELKKEEEEKGEEKEEEEPKQSSSSSSQSSSSSVIFPSVQVHNVIALPGVPRFCEGSFEIVEEHLFSEQCMAAPFFSKSIYLNKSEINLQQRLTQLAESYADEKSISIGSYPMMGHSYYKTRLSVESCDPELGQTVLDSLSQTFAGWMVSYDPEPWMNAHQKLVDFQRAAQSAEFSAKLEAAIQTIFGVLDEYGLEKTCISFNGGKDCTILLHLFRACVDAKFGPGKQIEGFYIEDGDEFPEVEQFVRSISKSYNLKVLDLHGTIKSGLAKLKQLRPDFVAVIMGSRFSDPRASHMKSKCEWTEKGWPEFFRVCPILDWSYSDVWHSLRGLCIPYCSLYDEGYSSLGERTRTAKNPHLRVISSQETGVGGGATANERYNPAHMLSDGRLERAFREDSATDDTDGDDEEK